MLLVPFHDVLQAGDFGIVLEIRYKPFNSVRKFMVLNIIQSQLVRPWHAVWPKTGVLTSHALKSPSFMLQNISLSRLKGINHLSCTLLHLHHSSFVERSLQTRYQHHPQCLRRYLNVELTTSGMPHFRFAASPQSPHVLPTTPIRSPFHPFSEAAE